MKQLYLLLTAFFFVCMADTPAIASAGDPSQFGSNVWNVYAWNAGDANGGNGAWSMNYTGYYVDSSELCASNMDQALLPKPSYSLAITAGLY